MERFDFEEFVAVMSRKVDAQYTPSQVRSAFKTFEGDSPPGFIHIKDLEKALCEYSTEKVNQEQAKELIQQLGAANSSGLINYDEFVGMLLEK